MMTLDAFIEALIASVRTPFLISLFSVFTFLGGWFIFILALAAVIHLLLIKQSRKAYLFVASILAGQIIEFLLKNIFQRARPLEALSSLPDYSFPSGHAMRSVLLFGFFYYSYRDFFKARGKRIILTIAIMLILLVGISRAYLGVHWLSDVLGGYALGGILLALVILLDKKCFRNS